MARVAINGFGRIGRLVARSICERRDCGLELIAINELADPRTSASLFARDSVHGRFAGEVVCNGRDMIIDGVRVQMTSKDDPRTLPHAANGIDIVLECTGRLASRAGAELHLFAGARRVLVSAPATDADLTVVFGINQDRLRPAHRIVSSASCTTNCLAVVSKVLNEAVGIARGLTRTIHGYTADQPLLDRQQYDLRRARAGGVSIIPLATFSPDAVGDLLPELKGRIRGSAVRVPVPNVSLIELIFEARQRTTRDEINAAFEAAAESGSLSGLLRLAKEPFVSTDFGHSSESAIVDALETKVVGETMVRIVSWYDNEWAYAQRVIDVAVAMSSNGLCPRGNTCAPPKPRCDLQPAASSISKPPCGGAVSPAQGHSMFGETQLTSEGDLRVLQLDSSSNRTSAS